MYPFWIFKKNKKIPTRNKAVKFSNEQWLQSEIPGMLPETVGEGNTQSDMFIRNQDNKGKKLSRH